MTQQTSMSGDARPNQMTVRSELREWCNRSPARPGKVFGRAAGLFVGLAAAFATGAALAHHSFSAEFDADRPVELTGKVTGMKWSNPHAWIYIDVEDEDGNVVNWALETRAANGLIRRGWRKEDLPEGTVLKVEGWQARNGSPTANISKVTFEDGRTLFAGSSNPAARQE